MACRKTGASCLLSVIPVKPIGTSFCKIHRCVAHNCNSACCMRKCQQGDPNLVGKYLEFPADVNLTLDLFGNSVSCRTNLAKYIVFCLFPAEVVWQLKFPNNSIVCEGFNTQELATHENRDLEKPRFGRLAEPWFVKPGFGKARIWQNPGLSNLDLRKLEFGKPGFGK